VPPEDEAVTLYSAKGRIGGVPNEHGRQAFSLPATPTRPPIELADSGLFPEKNAGFRCFDLLIGGVGSGSFDRVKMVRRSNKKMRPRIFVEGQECNYHYSDGSIAKQHTGMPFLNSLILSDGREAQWVRWTA
jgi:hypothetical protein